MVISRDKFVWKCVPLVSNHIHDEHCVANGLYIGRVHGYYSFHLNGRLTWWGEGIFSSEVKQFKSLPDAKAWVEDQFVEFINGIVS